MKSGKLKKGTASRGVRLLKQLMASHHKTEEEYEALLVTLPSHISNFSSLERTPALTEDRLNFLKTKVRALRYAFDIEAVQRAWGPIAPVHYNAAIVADFVNKLQTLFTRIHVDHPLRIHAELAYNLRVNLADVIVVEDLLVKRYFGPNPQYMRARSRMSSRMYSISADSAVESQDASEDQQQSSVALPFPRVLLLIIFVFSAPFPTLNVLFHTQLEAQACHGRPPTFGRQIFDAIGTPEWGVLINWVGCLSTLFAAPSWFPRMQCPLLFNVSCKVVMKEERQCYPFAVAVGDPWDPVRAEEEEEERRLEAERERERAKSALGKGKGKKPGAKAKPAPKKEAAARDAQAQGVRADGSVRLPVEPPLLINGEGVGKWPVRWNGSQPLDTGKDADPTSPVSAKDAKEAKEAKEKEQKIAEAKGELRPVKYMALYDISSLIAPQVGRQGKGGGMLSAGMGRMSSYASVNSDSPRMSFAPPAPRGPGDRLRAGEAPGAGGEDAAKGPGSECGSQPGDRPVRPKEVEKPPDGPRTCLFGPFSLFTRGADALAQDEEQGKAAAARPTGGLRKGDGPSKSGRARAAVSDADADLGGDRVSGDANLTWLGSLYTNETWSEDGMARALELGSGDQEGSEGSEASAASPAAEAAFVGESDWMEPGPKAAASEAGTSAAPSQGGRSRGPASVQSGQTGGAQKLHTRELATDEEDRLSLFVAKVHFHAEAAAEAASRLRQRLYQKLREPFCCTRHIFEQLRYFSLNDRQLICEQCTREKHAGHVVMPLSQHCAMETMRLSKKEQLIRDMVEGAQFLAKEAPVDKDALHRHVDDEIDSLIAALNQRKKMLKIDIDERKRREQEQIEREVRLCEDERQRLDMAMQILDAMGRQAAAVQDGGVEQLFKDEPMAAVLRQEASYDQFWQMADIRLHRPMGIATGLDLALPVDALKVSSDRLDWSVPKKHLSRRIYPPVHVPVPQYTPSPIITQSSQQLIKAPAGPRRGAEDVNPAAVQRAIETRRRLVDALESMNGVAFSLTLRQSFGRFLRTHAKQNGVLRPVLCAQRPPEGGALRAPVRRLAAVTPEQVAVESGRLPRDTYMPKEVRRAYDEFIAMVMEELKNRAIAHNPLDLAEVAEQLRQIPRVERYGMIAADAVEAALSYDAFVQWIHDYTPVYAPEVANGPDVAAAQRRAGAVHGQLPSSPCTMPT